jgi:hypothetical protein
MDLCTAAVLVRRNPLRQSVHKPVVGKTAEVPGRRQPIWQDGEGHAARMTDSAPHPYTLVRVIVGLTYSPGLVTDNLDVTDAYR